jgi:hypothetical protein
MDLETLGCSRGRPFASTRLGDQVGKDVGGFIQIARLSGRRITTPKSGKGRRVDMSARLTESQERASEGERGGVRARIVRAYGMGEERNYPKRRDARFMPS